MVQFVQDEARIGVVAKEKGHKRGNEFGAKHVVP